ncbi:MAG: hypothetical protein LBE18_11850 [Planctomycetaceae bacterium]|jgi:tetratricopeptide (TPR) repeat protein|nr:hypothetical protein [Planctomycetaceae bacterium]
MYKNFSLAVILLFVFSIVSEVRSTEFTIVNEAEVLYGKGVHAFFEGDYNRAIEIFKKVEYLASEDPRPYFFMAIAHYRLDKKSADADKYFKKAAKLEWDGKAVHEYDVADAISRIQGNERLHIEQYRTQAKIEWQKTNSIKENIKYGQQNATDKKIVADISKAFVGSAEFGASSPDPFKNDKNNLQTNNSNDLLTKIIDSAKPITGDPTETINISTNDGNYDLSPIEGPIQIEGQMIIDEDDIFAEFDDNPQKNKSNTDLIKVDNSDKSDNSDNSDSTNINESEDQAEPINPDNEEQAEPII